MAVAIAQRRPVAATDEERPALTAIAHLLNAGSNGSPVLVGPSGEAIELPGSVSAVLLQVVEAMVQNQAVSVVPLHKQLTTQEAADLLGVSRPYLVHLLDDGTIPFTKTGTHRRVRFDDLMEYKTRRDAARREGLDRLTRLSQEYGLYDDV